PHHALDRVPAPERALGHERIRLDRLDDHRPSHLASARRSGRDDLLHGVLRKAPMAELLHRRDRQRALLVLHRRRVDSLLRDDLSRAADGMTMRYLRQIQLASALVLLAASTAFAHGDVDEHARLSDLPWSSEWWIWIPLVLSLVLYVVGFRHVW